MRKKIYNDVYMQDFHLIFLDDLPKGKRPHDCCGWTVSEEGGIFIYLKKGATVRELAHEVDHAVSMLFDERGIERQIVDEAYAYMIGWLFKECYKRIVHLL